LSIELERLTDRSARERICRDQAKYVQKYHNPSEISKKMACIYHQVIGDE
jgi:hypothetical protein